MQKIFSIYKQKWEYFQKESAYEIYFLHYLEVLREVVFCGESDQFSL